LLSKSSCAATPWPNLARVLGEAKAAEYAAGGNRPMAMCGALSAALRRGLGTGMPSVMHGQCEAVAYTRILLSST
jgi:hypothetical protein